MKNTIINLLSKEYVRYVLCGINTTIVNYLVYIFCRCLGLTLVVSNVIAFICAVSVAFFINKKWVFKKEGWTLQVILQEYVSFISLRIVSMLYDTSALYILVKVLMWNEYFTKVFNSVVVMLLNYLFGKFITFRKG